MTAIFLWPVIILIIRFLKSTVTTIQLLFFNLWLYLRDSFEHFSWLYECFAHIAQFPSPTCACHSFITAANPKMG